MATITDTTQLIVASAGTSLCTAGGEVATGADLRTFIESVVPTVAPKAHKTSHENGGLDEISVAGLSGLLADDQNPLAHASDHAATGTDRVTPAAIRAVWPIPTNYVSGTGTAGSDNTAQTVKTISLAANSLVRVGDRMRIRAYWRGDSGTPITGSVKVNSVTVAAKTDGGGASLQVCEAWLHYLTNSTANIIETGDPPGPMSQVNVGGFNWNSSQNLEFYQNAAAGNRTILFFFAVDIFPLGA